MSDTPQSNPWKGLNTYVEGEVIYGRDDEITQLAAQVTQSTQTVLYGRSGIGKSSIINAGIFPRVRHEGYFPVSIRLEHNAGPYTAQIRRAVMQALADLRPGREDGPCCGQAEELVPLHGAEADESLWEFFHRFRYTDHKGRPVRPLVVIDQFEEIFTLAADRQKVDGFFAQLADLFNGIMPDELVTAAAPEAAPEPDPADLFSGLAEQMQAQSYLTESAFSIVIVLREDFLSYLERATAFIPSLKSNRCPLRPINDEQAADIIMQPRPGLVPKDVAELIIQRITGDDTVHIDNVPEVEVDSAILSLYLSRLYDKMLQQGLTHFTRELVEAYSSNIISDFYEESTRGLSFTALRFLEEELVNREGRRDNRDRLTVLERTGLSAAQLDRLVRDVKLLRQFSYGGTLRIEFIHDILCPTIVAHRQKMAMQRAARRTRHRLWLGITGVLAVCFVVGTWLAVSWWQNDAEKSECYASFTRRNGWPEGVGQPLGKGGQARTPLYYRLSKRGHKAGPFTRVEVCSPNALLPDEPRIECLEVNPATDNFASPDVRARAFADMLSQVEAIDFAAGEDGRIEKEVMRGEGGKPLFVVSYFHQSDDTHGRSKHEAWQTFLTPEGRSLKVRDNRLDRAKVVWDSVGRLSAVTWYDEQGVTRAAADSVFGYRFTYAGGDTIIRRALDDCGLLLQPRSGWNTLVTARRGSRTDRWYALLGSEDDTDRWRELLVNAHMGCAHTVDSGRDTTLYYRTEGPAERLAARVVRTADAHGNVTLEAVRDARGAAAAAFLRHHPARTVCTYDAVTGRRTLRKRTDAHSRPFAPAPAFVHTESWRYLAADGRLLQYAASSARGMEYAVSRTYDARQRITDESSERYGTAYSRTHYAYTEKGHTLHTVITCLDRQGRPANQLRHAGYDALSVSRIVTDSASRRVTHTFYALTPDGRNAPLPVVRDTFGTAISFARLTDTYDADGNRITQQAFDALGNVVRSMRYEFQNGELIARYAMSLDGQPVRCPLWEEEGYAYYKMYFTRNFEGQFNALKTVNEWRRPSVFYDFSGKEAQQIRYFNLRGTRLQTGIAINADIYTYQLGPAEGLSRQKAPYLHFHHPHHPLHDRYGLRDGDRIVRLGTWRLGQSEEAFRTEWVRLMQGRPAAMTVAVPIVAGNREAYKERELTIAGITAAHGEDYHFLPLTADEAHALGQVSASNR